MDLNGLAKEAFETAKARGQKTDALSCLKHCSGELVEATEAVCWLNHNNGQDYFYAKDEVELEISDVIMCMLTLSVSLNIDIEHALNKCLEKNRKRASEGQALLDKLLGS